MDDLMKILKERPDLQGISETLQAILKEEAKLREEFYNAIDEDDKAEFINGEVIMHSPAKYEHNTTSVLLMNLLVNYILKHDLGDIFSEKAMVHLSRNSYEPDIVFFKKERADFKQGQMLYPAPDFVVEILSPSTEKNDRGIKFEDYALHNVIEYWIINPVAETIEQYLLNNGGYVLEFKGKNGVITSSAIKGFSVNVEAAFSRTENAKALKTILQ